MNVILRDRKKVHRIFTNPEIDYNITQCGIVVNVHDMDTYTKKSVTCKNCLKVKGVTNE